MCKRESQFEKLNLLESKIIAYKMYYDQRKALDLFFQYYQENLKKCLACFDYFQLIEVKKYYLQR